MQLRRSHLLPHLRPDMTGLEIGAYTRPTLAPADAAMRYLDYYSTEELREQLQREGQSDESLVHVDYVVKHGRYSIRIPEKFDLIIANHVMEHCCNPIDWINDLGSMLRSEGLLFLALPDKKFSFDKYRPDTDVSHLVYNYFSDEQSTSEEHALEVAMYYDLNYINMPMTIERLDAERLRTEMKVIHPGLHVHVFQGETFLNKIIKPILLMQLCPFRIAEYVASTQYGEFYVILRKGWEKPDLTFEEFYSA